ncbi:type IV pilin-like G/H family protein [Oscillatoria sp. FACHB-1406]|uniref:type IV pilin-like G/H family protein n=1 Tax=Oscillatoria sp. FACHB-1406 TaxID=2692846 RepID=UPI00168246CA|nr:type IV pilin-like G/H family protein [Oscillatoria sp. FACHB-1406]MBD2577309.1 type IV pilin-like G/H family protein [Oscillatoria sp. FACHB-1406]
MKRDFQAKFLRHLSDKKKAEEGFTLIELLVVIIIIGILAAIALPSLLGQVNKGRQAEARNNTGSGNRAQQAFFLENQKFATNMEELGAGLRTQTKNYRYSINTTQANGLGSANFVARPIKPDNAPNNTLKAYVGIVGTIVGDAQIAENLTVGLVCEAKKPFSVVTIDENFKKDLQAATGTEDACVKSIDDKWKDLS